MWWSPLRRMPESAPLARTLFNTCATVLDPKRSNSQTLDIFTMNLIRDATDACGITIAHAHTVASRAGSGGGMGAAATACDVRRAGGEGTVKHLLHGGSLEGHAPVSRVAELGRDTPPLWMPGESCVVAR